MMKEQIDEAVAVLRSGGIILYPTDTVWGIGCDATNDKAVEKVNALKCSEGKAGMIVLVDSVDNVPRYTSKAPEVAWQLLEATDKPLTLILPGGCGVAGSIIADDGSLAVRVPDHEFCHALLRRLGRPLVSTSANISGEPTPMKFRDIKPEISAGVDLVIDPMYEKGATGKPSSLIWLGQGGEIKIIRE